MRTLTFISLLAAASFLSAQEPVQLTVFEKVKGQPVPCRIHLKDPAGKPVKAEGLPFWHDHFVCPGTAALSLPPGKYVYEVERGPEYARCAGTFEVGKASKTALQIQLVRLVNMPKEDWWPGELHVHRPVEDIPLLMQAEDLHVAGVITWWNNRNHWAKTPRLPETTVQRFDADRFCDLMGGEDERGGGALLYFGLRKPLNIVNSAKEYPSAMKFLLEAQAQDAWIDIEKPFWWDVPIWLASGKVKSIGLANNHMNRSKMYESEAWGKPRDVARLTPPRGNGYWTQEIYYHILNAGLRLPPSAGSASGVLPNPVGYNRVYVFTGPGLDYAKWWQGLAAGRSFVTNGPLLRVHANGQVPGNVFTAAKNVTIDLKARLTSRDPISFVEIIKNGQVERKVPIQEVTKAGSLGALTFKKSGWFLVRAIADNTETFRFASTAPFYVEIGSSQRRVSKASAQFFLDWLEERARRINLEHPTQQQEVVRHITAARTYWQEVLASANAP